jgi:hypothetical protein
LIKRQIKQEINTEEAVKEDVKPIPAKLTETEFFSLILAIPMIGHAQHLRTDSFAIHKALNKFYIDADQAADYTIEAYQGCYGKIVNYDLGFIADLHLIHQTPLEFLTEVKQTLCDNRYDIIPREKSNLQNELDNLITVIDHAIYKITFLK